MGKIIWGIIGCGNVTEVKSGPAFNKVPNSELLAVMRRDADKARDYAYRHGVPEWYNQADAILNHKEINAIYIATPPDSHEFYALRALEKEKFVYLEKPMSTDLRSARRIMVAAEHSKSKLSVAHYRRAQPMFKRIKEIVHSGLLGSIRFIDLKLLHPILTETDLEKPGIQWRLQKNISGGGLFHDLAPHQLDILYQLFGKPIHTNGFSQNQAGLYDADDIVTGSILFEQNIVAQCSWCFTLSELSETDICSIHGSKGILQFSFFRNQPLQLINGEGTHPETFPVLPHVQEPMISEVVQYFLGNAPNPCSATEGVDVIEMMDSLASSPSPK